jgi:hypothetical protein
LLEDNGHFVAMHRPGEFLSAGGNRRLFAAPNLSLAIQMAGLGEVRRHGNSNSFRGQ